MNGDLRCLTKGEYVYRVLRDRIFTGDLQKDRIYKVVELAEELGVSRTPVSEAVKILVSQGYLIMLPGVGFRVKALTRREINEILTISSVLEKLALETIIARKAPMEYGEMREMLDRCEQSVLDRDVDEYARLTEQFHKTLYRAAGMPKLVEVLDSVSIHEALYQESVLRSPGAILTLINDHRLLLDIVENGRTDKIDGFLARHVKNCEVTHEIYLEPAEIEE